MQPILFVPGLGDMNKNIKFVTYLWKKEGMDLQVHLTPWQEKKETFEEKLERLVKKIDMLSKKSEKISLIGTGAGGSLVVNAFLKRKHKIHKLITISSRLLKGRHVFPTLSIASLGYPAFRNSVLACESALPSLTLTDKAKMMTTQSLFFDEVVPFATSTIPGVRNIKIALPFHSLSIAAALIFYRKQLITFING